MRNLLSLALTLLLFTSLPAQNPFVPGWYVIQPTATYSVLLMSSADMGEYMKSGRGVGKTDQAEVVSDLKSFQSGLPMAQNEVVFVFDQSKDTYLAFDPLGRMVAFKGAGTLRPAKVAPSAGVGHIAQKIQLISGEELTAGSFVWVTNQDVGRSVVTIQIADDRELEIPQEKISLWSADQRRNLAQAKYVPVK